MWPDPMDWIVLPLAVIGLWRVCLWIGHAFDWLRDRRELHPPPRRGRWWDDP